MPVCAADRRRPTYCEGVGVTRRSGALGAAGAGRGGSGAGDRGGGAGSSQSASNLDRRGRPANGSLPAAGDGAGAAGDGADVAGDGVREPLAAGGTGGRSRSGSRQGCGVTARPVDGSVGLGAGATGRGGLGDTLGSRLVTCSDVAGADLGGSGWRDAGRVVADSPLSAADPLAPPNAAEPLDLELPVGSETRDWPDWTTGAPYGEAEAAGAAGMTGADAGRASSGRGSTCDVAGTPGVGPIDSVGDAGSRRGAGDGRRGADASSGAGGAPGLDWREGTARAAAEGVGGAGAASNELAGAGAGAVGGLADAGSGLAGAGASAGAAGSFAWIAGVAGGPCPAGGAANT